MLKKLFSVCEFSETHNLICFLGIKLRLPKPEYEKLKKQNPFYLYKKNNAPITQIPAATGQIRDIQMANFTLLKQLHKFCQENNLGYWLDYGTLLGAVRHKGYIPWDDDIDVGMMMSDYVKVEELFNSAAENSDFYIEKFTSKKGRKFLKLKHRKCDLLFVDIFPYEDCGEKIHSICYPNEYHAKTVIFPLGTTEFEKKEFTVPANTDRYLKDLFNDYMKYPDKITMGHSMFIKLNDNQKSAIEDIKCLKI